MVSRPTKKYIKVASMFSQHTEERTCIECTKYERMELEPI